MSIKVKLVLKDSDARKFLGSPKQAGEKARKTFSEAALERFGLKKGMPS